jgi:hypothetical protein
MKRARLIWAVMLGLLTAVVAAGGATYSSVMVSNTGALYAPTNFFRVNSNALNAAVAQAVVTGISTNYSGVVSLTNLANQFAGNGAGLTNLQSTNIVGTVAATQTNISYTAVTNLSSAPIPGTNLTGVVNATTATNSLALGQWNDISDGDFWSFGHAGVTNSSYTYNTLTDEITIGANVSPVYAQSFNGPLVGNATTATTATNAQTINGNQAITNGHSVPVTISNTMTLKNGGAELQFMNGELAFGSLSNNVSWFEINTNGWQTNWHTLRFPGAGFRSSPGTRGIRIASGGLYSEGDPQFDSYFGFNANEPRIIFNNAVWLAMGSLGSGTWTVTGGNNFIVSGTLTVTNGLLLQVTNAGTGSFTCSTNKQFYLINSNQVATLPNAAQVGSGWTCHFASTNATGWIVTNSTGTQPVYNGSWLSYTNLLEPTKVIGFVSDGAAWLPIKTDNAATITGTNLVLSSPKWTDAPAQWFWGATGPTAPDTTAVTNNSLINGMGFTLAGEGAQKVYGSAQIPHSIATSNSTLYTEWHLHVSPATAITTTSNVAFTIVYDWANIAGNRYGPITNTAQVGMVDGKFNNLLEFGNTSFTNFAPSVSAISRCTVYRSAASSNDFSGVVILDGADVHFPVDRLGSSTDSAP